MSQLRQYEDEFQRRNLAVAVVTFDGLSMAKAYVESTQLKWPMLIDSDRQLYSAYGLENADLWTTYGPVTAWRHIRLLWNGARLQKLGKHFRQLGGDILIDPQGVIRWLYRSEDPHDRPDATSILEQVDASK